MPLSGAEKPKPAPGRTFSVSPFPLIIKKGRANTGPADCLLQGLLLDADLLAVAADALEADLAVGKGEQRVVAAAAHVLARMDVGAALTHQNVASQHELPVSALGAKALGLGITAVLGGAHTFFMGKELQRNVQHFQVPSFL